MNQPVGHAAADFLEELVSIPSVNPGFRTAGDDPGIFGEQRMAELLGEFFRRIGCEVWFEEILPGRHNLMARLRKGDGGRSIALQCHLDTVQVRGMTVNPWGLRDGDRLYGRGSCDTKASIAAFAKAIQVTAESARLDADLYFVGTVDEEHGFAGSHHLGQKYKFDACIVGEPTSLGTVTAHKGSVRFGLTAEGMSAHSSTPELGHNAILEMLDLLQDFRTEFDRYTGSWNHPLTGRATWAPTLITGGVGRNTVPEVCTVAIDRRVVPGEQVEDVIDFVDDWSKRNARAGHPWRLGEIYSIDIPFETGANTPPVEALGYALAKLGMDSGVKGMPCGTDAPKIAAGGTPCVVFGPGNIAQAHKSDEWIHLPDVELATDIVIEALKSLDRILKR